MKKKILTLALTLSMIATPLGVNANETIALNMPKVEVYQTVKNGDMDMKLPDLQMKTYDQKADTQKTVRIFAGDERQEILGIGGAMTESTAYNLSLLSPEKQKEVYDAYFSKDGANYSIVRSSIGSADFSVKSYSYNDTEKPDPELKNFSIDGDREYVLPALKRIKSYRNDMKFFAAPWAPPAWMKKSGVRRGQTGTAALKLVDNSIDTKYFDSYAQYFVNYLKAYKNEGIDIFSISIQNEAQNNPKWEACTWSINDTAEFIGKHLGPKLEENGLDPELLIWDWDKGNDPMHGDGFIKYNLGVLNNAEARKYIDGIAFHWYAGDVWHEIAGKPMWSRDFYSLDEVKKVYPNIKFYATEACQEKGPWLGSFDPADRYIYDILNDFEHGTSSWIDWNLLLDSEGGPTQGVVNKCHAPIMLDKNLNLVYNPAYYILKRLSKEIQPGTKSIRSDINFEGIEKTAVKKANGDIAVFLGNVKDYAQTVNVVDSGKMVTVNLPAHSMTTLVYSETTDAVVLKPISAYSSSYEWHPWKDYRANSAIDNNKNSRWASDWKDNESITFELDDERVVTGIKLLFENGQDSEFKILTSYDGVNFEEVKRVQKNTFRQQKDVFITFEPSSAKYVRFQGVSRNNRYGYSIYDAYVVGY